MLLLPTGAEEGTLETSDPSLIYFRCVGDPEHYDPCPPPPGLGMFVKLFQQLVYLLLLDNVWGMCFNELGLPRMSGGNVQMATRPRNISRCVSRTHQIAKTYRTKAS